MGCGPQDPPRPSPAPSATLGALGLTVLARETGGPSEPAGSPRLWGGTRSPHGQGLYFTDHGGDLGTSGPLRVSHVFLKTLCLSRSETSRPARLAVSHPRRSNSSTGFRDAATGARQVPKTLVASKGNRASETSPIHICSEGKCPQHQGTKKEVSWVK